MSQIQWMWEKDDGSGYTDYDPDITNLLELIYSNCAGVKSKNFVIPYKDFRWRFDFNEMTQKNEISGSKRKIIRVENGKVWIWYDNKISDVRQFYLVDDKSILELLDSFNPPPGFRSHKNPPNIITYVSKNPKRSITCRNLKNYSSIQECDDDVIIQLVDVNTLRPPAAAAVAPQYQPQPQYPSQAAAAVTQQQSPLPADWIEQRSPEGIPFYVYTPTGQSVWNRPAPTLPPGWTEKYDKDERKYYENLSLNTTQIGRAHV